VDILSGRRPAQVGTAVPDDRQQRQDRHAIAVPWYWNIAPNYDATFTGRYYSSRGHASIRSFVT